MATRYDYRRAQARSLDLQAQADAIRDKAAGRALTAEEQRKVDSLELEAVSDEMFADALKEREAKQLADIGKNGVAIGSADGAGEISDLLHYVKAGEIRNASLSSTDANGGYIISEPAHAALVEKIRNSDPIFAGAHQFDMSLGDVTMVLPYKSAHGAVANATEAGARSEQNAPTFEAPSLTCFDYYTDQRASQQWVDSIPGAETLMLQWIYEDIYEQAGVDFAVGDGNGKASGLFEATGTYITKLSGAAGALANTVFPLAFVSLPPKHRANAVWLMNSATLAVAAAYVYPNTQIPLVDFSGDMPRIMGKPVLEVHVGAGDRSG